MTIDEANQKSTLINRNVIINNRRTSIRLEAEMWSDLRDISRRENKTIHEICTLVQGRKHKSRSLTSAIRVFLIAYYRSAATEDGHVRAGHGQGYQLVHRSALADERRLGTASGAYSQQSPRDQATIRDRERFEIVRR